MSRLTDLIAQAKAKDLQLGTDLERELRVFSSRRPFGLNFERHRPEAVELSQRPIRKGDKVRVLPERGSTERGDARLWQIKAIRKSGGGRVADLELLGTAEPETRTVASGAKLHGVRAASIDGSHADLSGADLTGASFTQVDLQHARLNDALIEGATFRECRVFGTAAWGLRGTPALQDRLYVTPINADVRPPTGIDMRYREAQYDAALTVDLLELAPIVYAVLNRESQIRCPACHWCAPHPWLPSYSFHLGDVMKAFTIVAVGSLSTLSSGVSIAQSGHMMDGSGWMGGYGGVWGPIVLVVIVALVVWAVLQRRK